MPARVFAIGLAADPVFRRAHLRGFGPGNRA